MATVIRKPHKHVTPARGGSHQSYAWWHADAAARLAQPLVVDDLRRWSLQLDTLEVWEVASTSPASWRRVIGEAPELVALRAADAAAVHVYVAPTGNDNAAGTIADPLATIAGAWRRLPAVQTGCFVVHLPSGSHVWTAPPEGVQRPTANIIVIGDGAGQGADDGLTVLASGVVVAGSTASTIAVDAMTAGAYLGATLEITSGVAAGCRRGIVDTTATTIRLAVGTYNTTTFGAATVAAGDTWRIVRPAVLLTNPGAGSLRISWGSRVSLVGVSIPAAIVAATPIQAACWFGVELRGDLKCEGELYLAYPFEREYGAIWEALWPGAPSSWVRFFGWGLSSCNGSSFGVVDFHGPIVRGYVYFDSGYIPAGSLIAGGRAGRILATQGEVRITSAGVVLSGVNGVITLGGNARLYAAAPVECVDPRGGSSIAILIDGTAKATLNGLTITTSHGVGGVAIDMNGTAELEFLPGAVLTINTPGVAIRMAETSTLNGYSLVTTGTVGLQSGARCVFRNANCGYLTLSGQALFRCDYGPTVITATAASAGAVSVYQDACVEFLGSGTLTIQNLATTPIAHGVLLAHNARMYLNPATTITTAGTGASHGAVISGNAVMFSTANPTITSTGTAGYGVNCRGGGTFTCATAPAGVSGTLADFTVSADVGGDFADTDLAAASARTAGRACVQRVA